MIKNKDQQTVRVIIIGDLVGNPGLALFKKWAPLLKKDYCADMLVVNGENVAKEGKGITPKIYTQLKEAGADVVTTGNHAWDNKEIYLTLDTQQDIIRPANYPTGCNGRGYTFFSTGRKEVAVINLHGRVFIPDSLDCPFRTIESLLTFIRSKTPLIIVDFHAEATSEKSTMGLFLDGRISCLVGTHTHIQTADERILPKGTAYITDLGCSGSLNSVIGFSYAPIIEKYLKHPKAGKFIVSHDLPLLISGVVVDIDEETGKATHIQRIRIIDEDITIDQR